MLWPNESGQRATAATGRAYGLHLEVGQRQVRCLAVGIGTPVPAKTGRAVHVGGGRCKPGGEDANTGGVNGKVSHYRHIRRGICDAKPKCDDLRYRIKAQLTLITLR